MKPQTIRLKSILLPKSFLGLATLAMLAFAGCAHAKVSCTISSLGFTTAYGSLLNITASNFTVTCTANAAGGTVTYQVAANNGINFLGAQNRALNVGSFLNYNLASDPGCATAWKGTTYIPATPYTITFAGVGTDIKTYSYYGCVPAGQPAGPTGIYIDTVTMSYVGGALPGGYTFPNSTFPVSITAPATCSITTPPGNITFIYTAFSAAAVLASTTFSTTCNSLLPYTMALDTTSGTIVGVNYTLALSAAGGTGTGLAQTYTINGTVAAGQAGTCAAATCAGAQTHSLTITY